MADVVERFPHPKYPRLRIERRADSKYYQGIARVGGKLRQSSTKTTHLATAFKLAEDWLRKQLRAEADRPLDRLGTDPTVAEVFASWKATLDPKKRAYAEMKWSTIGDFWRAHRVSDVTPQTFREFFKWRRRFKNRQGKPIKNHTLHKDVMVVRQVLKSAIEEDHIKTLPIIPKVGKIEANPRPWLTPDEWKYLLEVSAQRLVEAQANPRVLRQRQDLDDFMRFMVASMCRVDEAKNLRFSRCRDRLTQGGGGIALIAEVTGKRGTRTIVAPAVAYVIVIDRRDRVEGDQVFPEHHRDAFRELLIAAGLRYGPNGDERNFKSLRETAISFRILEPDANLLAIARNAGTSLTMIDNFYAKRLTAEMHIDQLAMPLDRAEAFEDDYYPDRWKRKVAAKEKGSQAKTPKRTKDSRSQRQGA